MSKINEYLKVIAGKESCMQKKQTQDIGKWFAEHDFDKDFNVKKGDDK